METINISAFKQLYHNGSLLEQAKETLYESVRNGTMIYIELPNGETIKLEDGFKIHDVEIIELKGEQTNER